MNKTKPVKIMSYAEYKDLARKAAKNVKVSSDELSDGAFDSMQMDIEKALQEAGYPKELATIFSLKIVADTSEANLKDNYAFYLKIQEIKMNKNK